MQRKAARLEAQRLFNEYGPAAYEKTLAAERVARRKHDKRLAKFLGEVARQIAGNAAGDRKDNLVRHGGRLRSRNPALSV